jgi:hypothetical protein
MFLASQTHPDIAFAQYHKLSMHQMDIVTAYLYGHLDKKIYMEAPPELIQ